MSYNEKDPVNEKVPSDTGSLEKQHPAGHNAYVAPADDDRYRFDAHDLDKVQRRLKQRHVQMIAIAGTIGTGLFLGSGKALARAGPLGALLAYAFIGSVAYSSLCSVGEMTCFAPISGTFPHFAARWVDPAFGFAVGWNYFYTQAITVPVEVTAAQILLTFWDDDHNRGIAYTAIILVFMCLINLFGVRWFGESEFVFSIIKLILITGLILFGFIIDLGGGPDHDRRGFRYWKNPGALNTYLVDEPKATGRFLGILGVLIQAAFSFQGMELVAIAASETESPRRNIAKAVRRVFYRILIFYILGRSAKVEDAIVLEKIEEVYGQTSTQEKATVRKDRFVAKADGKTKTKFFKAMEIFADDKGTKPAQVFERAKQTQLKSLRGIVKEKGKVRAELSALEPKAPSKTKPATLI
ncbi:hypothetical protein M407DRAFT_12255 [Tulasnella calospora MUT 4182]|uniref:Amino acid permease/ SLC12A domain-containing protein n=1 Tax=Tulasnella calospora MUT 4182 TaxID=1051891 RepID=A0A0C3L812_9AGAM|nr:hypothetical protein M407DRAFT_12255 [Tulasnella calospora MUT 4182]